MIDNKLYMDLVKQNETDKVSFRELFIAYLKVWQLVLYSRKAVG